VHSGLGEFEIIKRYFEREARDPAVILGVGDDAAVIDVDGPLVVAVDTLVEGRHFPPTLPPESVGHRSLAVNLSDLAAMGARPRWACLALTLPKADPDWLEAFAAGFFELASRFGVDLVGGDTTRGPLIISVQLLGTIESTSALTRAGGRPGDDVYVTGSLGDAAAALALLTGQESDNADLPSELMHRFAYPEPRVDMGLGLSALAHSAIDVSDGLVADLGHICERSRCGAELAVEKLPLSTALLGRFPLDAARQFALTGGDDYELCFTAAPEAAEAIEQLADSLNLTLTSIGRLTDGDRLDVQLGGRSLDIGVAGYAHF
jgi:thiamine-monophosphate kinase